jgi:hypothetical protein
MAAARTLPKNRVVHSAAVTALVAVAVLSGCGAQEYERRLAETTRYFDHLDLVESNLNPAWSSGPVTKFRTPKQYRLVNPPTEPGAPDLRQPPYAMLTLPGLVGAWEAPLSVDGQADRVTGYIYVLSNFEYWADSEKWRLAGQFNQDVSAAIAQALGVAPPKPEQWGEERLPRNPEFEQQKTYSTITLAPPMPINGVPMDFTLYLQQAGDIQVIVMLATPKNVGALEKLNERIEMALSSLPVSSTKPTNAQGTKGATSGASF